MLLCVHDLVELTGGQLLAAAMPPLAGAWVQVPRIVLEASLVEAGDLFWCLDDDRCDADLAYLRGAVGVVSAGRAVPWPGTFSLQVPDAVSALDRLVEALMSGDIQLAPSRFSVADEADAAADLGNDDSAWPAVENDHEESPFEAPELKVLQLFGAGGVDINPPTCGQSAKGLAARRCRRRAA